MFKSPEEIKIEVKKKEGKIAFDQHFYKKCIERPYLSEGLILEALKLPDQYVGCQEQKEKQRIKIGISLSRRYTLTIIMEIKEGIKIITAWKTSKKWKR